MSENYNFYTNVDIVDGKIAVRGYSDERGKWQNKIQPKLKMYLSSTESVGDIKTLYGGDAKSYEFSSIREAKDFIKRYEDVGGVDIFGQHNFTLQSIYNIYDHEIRFDQSKISGWSLDIETKLPVDSDGRPSGFPDVETANAEITLITMQRLSDGVTYVFSGKAYPGGSTPKFCTQFINAGSEAGLLRHFIDFWNSHQVDVITGWNIERFDIPYIINRCNLICGEDVTNMLSPWGKVSTFKKKISGSFGEEELVSSISGVSILDYMAIYKKFTFGNHESYSLNSIAMDELGEGKLDHSEFTDFNDFYDNGFKKYVDYNIRDTALVRRIDQKLQLLNLIYTIAYMAKVNFNDVFSPVKTWDALLHNRLMDDGKVVPIRESNPDVNKHIEGAYIKDPKVGFYDWVLSLDATSLYPSIMMTLNISPETYLGIDYNVSLQSILDKRCQFTFPSESSCAAVTGVAFDKSARGVIPTIVQEYMALRKSTKRSMLDKQQELENIGGSDSKIEADIASLDAKQMAFKILLNSLYGAMGNRGFRFFNSNVAETITLTGQYVLRSIEGKIDGVLNEKFGTSDHKYLIYIDTDSVYFDVQPIVKKWMSKKTPEQIAPMLSKVAVDQIQSEVNKIVSDCCDAMKAYENKLSFKLEVIGDKAIWVAKKKYVIRAHSSEGVVYKSPKFKSVGLEMIKSSTPKFIRSKLENLLPIIFDDGEEAVQDFLENSYSEFIKLSPSEMSIPKGMNNMSAFLTTDNSLCAKGTPMQVRAAISYNAILKKMGLDSKYQLIPNDSKIRYLYLKLPNKTGQNIIAYPVDAELPKELGLGGFIDVHTMWEKTMIASVEILLKPLGWTTERRMVLF